MASNDPTLSLKVKQPKELYILFTTEIWERFGYYLMIGLFAIYLTSHLKMDEADASILYGQYIAFVYLTPFFGGIIADRFLGSRKSVLLGAALMTAGYSLLAFIAEKTTTVTPALYGSLALLAIGNGFFKPNIGTLVGNLYPQGDPRRDGGFSIFYMAVNIGAFTCNFVGVYLSTKWGPAAAFAAAAVGMAIGFVNFAVQSHKLKAADQRSSVSAVLHVPLPKEYEDRRDPPTVEKQRIMAIFIMCAVVIFFWMAFHQNGSSLTFFAQKHTDLTFGGHIPQEWFAGKSRDDSYASAILQSVNPFFIITLTFPVIAFFTFLRKRVREITTPEKMAFGMVVTAASFVVMVLASRFGGNTGLVSPFWLIGSYFVVTIAELCLSPLGLSMVSKLAPRRMTSMMIGVWYLATFCGNMLAGYLGILWKRWPHDKFFMLLVIVSLVAAAILFIFLPVLKKALPKEQK